MEKAKRMDQTEVKTGIVDLEDDEKANKKSLIIPKEKRTTSTSSEANQMNLEEVVERTRHGAIETSDHKLAAHMTHFIRITAVYLSKNRYKLLLLTYISDSSLYYLRVAFFTQYIYIVNYLSLLN